MRFLVDFVAELRSVGIGTSMVEAADAAAALDHIDLLDRSQVRDTLAATLVKSGRHLDAFDAVFDVYFSTEPPIQGSPGGDARTAEDEALISGSGQGQGAGGGGGDGDLLQALAQALIDGDDALLQAVIRSAVSRFGGMEPGRPVGGSYYLYRVTRGLDMDALRSLLEAGGERGESDFDRRLRMDEVDRVLEGVRDRIKAEITRRLVADRGRLPVARTMRRPLAEDIDLSTASRADLARIESIVQPLARKLAARVAQRRRMGRRGRLDIRRTVRRSLSAGGALIDPSFRRPRPGRPDIVVIADVSGSVATFARFTMQLVQAVSSQLRRVRSYAFIDAVDEVTPFFGPGVDLAVAMARVSSEARVVWVDGHSNYGHALGEFATEHLDAVSPNTVVIITGDARTNYHEPNTAALARIAARARAVFWLNPEDRRYWDTGDSVIGSYAPHCDAVYEVRSLRHLERFVETVALTRSTIQPGSR